MCFGNGCTFRFTTQKISWYKYRDALHGELFFHSQSDVDEFVAESGHRKSKPQATVDIFLYCYCPDIRCKHICYRKL